MAIPPTPYDKQYWAVEIYSYDFNTYFTLNSSKLDGPDVLSGPTPVKSWIDISEWIVSIQIESGFDVLSGFIPQPGQGAASFTFQSNVFNPIQFASLRPGMPIRAKYLSTGMFQGRIDDVAVFSSPESNYEIKTIFTCSDGMAVASRALDNISDNAYSGNDPVAFTSATTSKYAAALPLEPGIVPTVNYYT